MQEIIGNTDIFLDKIFKSLDNLNINLDNNLLDHLCYRVSTEQEYQEKKDQLLKCSTLLIEADVNGRPISTFKFDQPISYKSRKIELIELPSPKKNTNYTTGLEHVEFVIEEGLDKFMEKYPNIDFDKSGMSKGLNPELRVSLADNLSVKFHPISLEKVIEIEKNLESQN